MQIKTHQPTPLDCQIAGSNLLAVVDFRETNDDDEMCEWLMGRYPCCDFRRQAPINTDATLYYVLLPESVAADSIAVLRAGV